MITVKCRRCGWILGILVTKISMYEVVDLKGRRRKHINTDLVVIKPIHTRVAQVEDFFELVRKNFEECPRCMHPLNFDKREVKVYVPGSS